MAATKKPMTKSQVNTHMAEKMGVTKKEAAAFIETFVGLATSRAKKDGAFTIPGIGKLVLQHRKARMGRNPQTGEPIKIKAKKVVKMRLAKACKDAILPPKKK